MRNSRQKRWRSRILWVSVASLVGFVLKTYLKVEIAEFDTLVNLVLAVFAAVGIINNPERNDSL